jgi:protein involved in polysaccharide export with SLBB domain
LVVYRKAAFEDPVIVYLQGEVVKPGRYQLTTDMHVADLIRLGGGLKPDADTQNADLTNYQWLNESQLTGQHEKIAIAAALANDPKSNVIIHAGDVLTIRELPNWKDLGATITLQGQVKHPGTYGIRPGERLSSVIEEAGGFQSDAYPLAAVLERPAVRDLEAKSRSEMILRVQDAQNNLTLLPDADPKQKVARDMAIQQWQATLDALSSNPPVGRVSIQISKDIDSWKNSARDIEVKADDTLVIPKRPGFVTVTGQVFNPTAISYRPGRSAKWYLSQAGGATQLANKKGIFVIRADGSVIGAKDSFLSGSSLGAELQPGDSVVVPEKALGGGVQWQNTLLVAQVASSVASSVFIALKF